MGKTVFVLGAGASAEAKVPVMNQFLDTARELLGSGVAAPWKRSFQAVFEAIGYLQRAHSKADLDLFNLEAVFSAFHMSKTLGLRQFQDKDLASEFKRVIHYVISSKADHIHNIHQPYIKFAKIVRHLAQNNRLSIITFNYDLVFDFVLRKNGTFYSYGEPVDHVARKVQLLKLHGSLNWCWCPECGEIKRSLLPKPYKVSEFAAQRFVPLDLGTCNKCTNHFEPFIVPPTYDKAEHHNTLQGIWQAAAASLSEAEDLYVIGYSLPDSDLFFRYLFALGTIGAAPFRRIWVFDPDPAVKERFRELLGPGAVRRFSFRNIQFHQFCNLLFQELGLSL